MKYLEHNVAYLEECDLSHLPQREDNANKGTFGKLLVIAGSKNMAGAAIFSAKAAFRSGVGLVKVFTPEENRIIIQSTVPEAILSTYDNDLEEDAVIKELDWADAIVIGPGLGRSESAKALVSFVKKFAKVPVVWDADALNILSENPCDFETFEGVHIVTPHPGEFSRLTGISVSQVKDNIQMNAYHFAKTHNVICVLKDHHTVITKNGEDIFVNMSGNHGMATAGSGDVLTGIIGALLAQGMVAFKASSFGVYLHGLAGDYARKKMGAHAMMASDLIDELKSVWKKVEEYAEQ